MSDAAGHWPHQQASTYFHPGSTLLDEPRTHPGLTGAFLFASTTARSSPALLGWNCGYALFSNVSQPGFAQATLVPPRAYGFLDHVRRTVCCHF